jgi:glycosyltransferase involved in cell wall biosynthesis
VINGKKIVVVMPAYNAAKTLGKTHFEIPGEIVDGVILVDDFSDDTTVEVARELGVETIVHRINKGYGANQKSCYRRALETGADIVIMLHPDYQYTPRLIPAMAYPISAGVFDCMLGSRILGVGALKGGMPVHKYMANRFLTLLQNLLLDYKLSEYHTGYRAFSRQVLETIPFEKNDDDFVFDNQILAQIIFAGFKIGEITCPTLYDTDSSSINFSRSVKYGLGVVKVSIAFFLHKVGIRKSFLFASLDSIELNRDADDGDT